MSIVLSVLTKTSQQLMWLSTGFRNIISGHWGATTNAALLISGTGSLHFMSLTGDQKWQQLSLGWRMEEKTAEVPRIEQEEGKSSQTDGSRDRMDRGRIWCEQLLSVYDSRRKLEWTYLTLGSSTLLLGPYFDCIAYRLIPLDLRALLVVPWLCLAKILS